MLVLMKKHLISIVTILITIFLVANVSEDMV